MCSQIATQIFLRIFCDDHLYVVGCKLNCVFWQYAEKGNGNFLSGKPGRMEAMAKRES